MVTKTGSIRESSRLWRVVQFPLTRIALAVAFVILGILTAQLVIGWFGTSTGSPAISVLSMIIALAAVYYSYYLYVQFIEKRPLIEMSAIGVKELGSGFLIGFGIVTTVIGILWAFDCYRVLGINPWLMLVPALVANVPSGFVQEILFRGILFRIMEESLGTWIALVISALLFGLIHVLSANATIFSTLSIVLEGGILLTSAYILTRRLWLAIGLHIAWDFAIDGVFGVGTAALSGKPMQGLLVGRLVGNQLLTGGAQGVETSLVAIMVALIAGCLLTRLAWRNGKFAASGRLFNQK